MPFDIDFHDHFALCVKKDVYTQATGWLAYNWVYWEKLFRQRVVSLPVNWIFLRYKNGRLLNSTNWQPIRIFEYIWNKLCRSSRAWSSSAIIYAYVQWGRSHISSSRWIKQRFCSFQRTNFFIYLPWWSYCSGVWIIREWNSERFVHRHKKLPQLDKLPYRKWSGKF